MSSVRMCDGCGDIFSEREDGWASMTGTQMKRDADTGRTNPVQTQEDRCPRCVDGGSMKPRLALRPTVQDLNQ